MGSGITKTIAQLVPSEIKKIIKPSRQFAQKPVMDKEDHLALCEIYKDEIGKLSALTGRDLNHWITH